MQEEVNQKTIALSMKTGKLTAQVLQAALKKYLQHRAKGKTMLHHGQQSLKQLKKHGAALSNIEITEANIGAFKPCAKKYGVDFALRKDKTTQPPHYVVIFKSKDADNLEQAFREFTAKTLSKEQRPSIRKVLSAMKQKTAEQTKQRAKEKIRERGLER
uniref:PcfB family protein n=1 Tax=Gemmiger qucibialis TaxID=2997294 RepID=UPI003FEDA1CA